MMHSANQYAPLKTASPMIDHLYPLNEVCLIIFKQDMHKAIFETATTTMFGPRPT
jgi:hypothetical protein